MRHFVVLFGLAVTPIAARAQYSITHTYPLGGDGSWDYIVPDSVNHRIFIGRQSRVMVVDENDGRLIGEVGDIHGAHGTAISLRSGRGFATSGNDSSIVMFDLKTLMPIARTPAAEDADAIIYDPVSNRVFSFNGDAHSATVVDAESGALVANVPLGGKPEYGAYAGNGMVYANLTDTSEVVEIDARSLKVTRRWSTAPCRQPVSMAIDRANMRLFSGCRSGVMAVSDIRAGAVVATQPIGQGNDGAAYDPSTHDAFFSNLDGTLTVVHQDSPNAYRIIQTVTTGDGGRNMGLDPVTHRIFVAVGKYAPLQAGVPAPRRRPIMPGSFAVLVIERSGR